jgi:hypothetical protein
MAQVDPTALMDGTYFVSRVECLSWLNRELCLTGAAEFAKVEQCATAVPYLQLVRRSFPRHASAAARMKANPATDYDRLHNWKLLQDVLFKAGLTRQIDIEKQAKGTYQLNLEFLQWFKRVYESRKQAGTKSPPLPAATAPTAASVPRTSPSRGGAVELELERNYYFEKLLRIERLMLSIEADGAGLPTAEHAAASDHAFGEGAAPTTAAAVASQLRQILYAE